MTSATFLLDLRAENSLNSMIYADTKRMYLPMIGEIKAKNEKF